MEENPFLASRSAAAAPASEENPFLARRKAAADPPEDANSASAASGHPEGYDRALEAARKATAHDAVGDAIYQGMTLGFGKDIDAVGAEATTGLENLVHRLRKEKIPYSADEAGRAVKQAEAENAEEFEAEHPIAKGALEFGGSMLTPGIGLANKGLKALGVASPLARALGVGAGLGGASSVGNSDGTLSERLSAAPAGAVAGATTAGALHGAGRLAGPLGRVLGPGAKEAAARVKEKLSGVRRGDVTDRAREVAKETGPAVTRQLANKLDQTGDKLKRNRAEVLGMDVTAAEALGPAGVAKLAAYGRLAGNTPEALYNSMWDRIHETPDAIVKDFSRVTGVDADAAVGNIDRLNQSLKGRSGPAYQAFYGSGPIITPEIQSLLETPAGKKALTSAMEMVANRRINPMDVGFVQAEVPLVVDGKPLMRGGRPIMIPGDTVELKTPTPMALDFIKRALDDMVEDYRDPKTKQLRLDTKGAGIKEVRDTLRGELTNPDQPWGKLYTEALNAGGEPIRNHEAFYKDAPRALSTRLKTYEFDKLMKGYEAKEGGEDSAQRKALQAGVVNEIREMAERNDIAGLKRFRTDETKRRLGSIFTPKQAEEMSELLKHRVMLLEWANQLLPTSGPRTSRDLAAMAEDKADMKQALKIAGHTFRGRPGKAFSEAISYVVEGAWDQAQAGVDEATRDVAGALLMMSPSEFAAAMAKAGADAKEAERATRALTDVGWFPPPAASFAGGTQRHSGITAEIEGQPDTRIDLNPDLTYSGPN